MTVEGLLNKLIEKGWRPFNKDIKEFFTLNEFTCGYRGEGTNHLGTIRAIVSKESGMRQFVCENGMVKENDDVRIKNYRGDNECDTNCCYDDYEYRLIESSLKDESELEDFLLQNIRIEDENNQKNK